MKTKTSHVVESVLPGLSTRATSCRNFALFGKCSALSRDHTYGAIKKNEGDISSKILCRTIFPKIFCLLQGHLFTCLWCIFTNASNCEHANVVCKKIYPRTHNIERRIRKRKRLRVRDLERYRIFLLLLSRPLIRPCNLKTLRANELNNSSPCTQE